MGKKFQPLDYSRGWDDYWRDHPQGYSPQEQMVNWSGQLNAMIDFFNEYFDVDLAEYATTVMEGWYFDGRLEDIINDVLFDSKADKTEVAALVQSLSVADGRIDTILDRIANTQIVITPTGGPDDTAMLQDTLNNHRHVKLTGGTFLVDPVIGIHPRSGSVITFEEATLQSLPTNAENYSIIHLEEVDHVRIIDPVIVGDRLIHTGSTGEWGMGISILGSDNIVIDNPTITNCWGDGIYIGSSDTVKNNKNVVIRNVNLSNNRRQGISIITCENLLIDGGVIANTNGTAPQAGIDIEPNTTTEKIVDLTIRNLVTKNNTGAGIHFFLFNSDNTTPSCNIMVEHCTFDGDEFGVLVDSMNKDHTGMVTIHNCVFKNIKKNGVFIRNTKKDGVGIYVTQPLFDNCNTVDTTNAAYNAPFCAVRQTAYQTQPLGPVVLMNPSYLRLGTYHNFFASFIDQGSTTVSTDCAMTNPMITKYPADGKGVIYATMGKFRLGDSTGALKNNLAATMSTWGTLSTKFTNDGATGALNLSLTNDTPIGFRLEATITKPYALTIIPAGGLIIGNGVAGKGVISSELGATIVLERVSPTHYAVISKTGTWTNQT